MPAVALFPILIEIDQQIDPPVQVKIRMFVEVGMDLQKASPPDLMKTSPAEIRVRDQSVDPRKGAEVFQEGLSVQKMNQFPRHRTKPVFAPGCQLLLIGIVEPDIFL